MPGVFPTAAIIFIACGSLLLADPMPDPDMSWVPEILGEGKLTMAQPPERPAGYLKYLDRCAEQLSLACKKAILPYLFRVNVKEEAAADNKCCRELALMGKSCHDRIVATLLSSLSHLKEESIEYYSAMVAHRSIAIRNRCALIAGVRI